MTPTVREALTLGREPWAPHGRHPVTSSTFSRRPLCFHVKTLNVKQRSQHRYKPPQEGLNSDRNLGPGFLPVPRLRRPEPLAGLSPCGTRGADIRARTSGQAPAEAARKPPFPRSAGAPRGAPRPGRAAPPPAAGRVSPPPGPSPASRRETLPRSAPTPLTAGSPSSRQSQQRTRAANSAAAAILVPSCRQRGGRAERGPRALRVPRAAWCGTAGRIANGRRERPTRGVCGEPAATLL